MISKYKKIIKSISNILFIIYMIILIYFLFFSDRYISDRYRYNLTLFKEITRFIRYRHEIGMYGVTLNLLGNILIFVPFGFSIPIIWSKYGRLLSVFHLSFLFSLTIEVIQLIFKVGAFDVDDILLNTIGGILGYLCFYFFKKLYRRL